MSKDFRVGLREGICCEEQKIQHSEFEGNLAIFTKKDRYFYFGNQVRECQEELMAGERQEQLNETLKKFKRLMKQVANDEQLEDIKGWSLDIIGTVDSVRCHDTTRAELSTLLDSFMERIGDLRKEEEQKERVEKARAFFTKLAEHAEDIAMIIDLEQIFG